MPNDLTPVPPNSRGEMTTTPPAGSLVSEWETSARVMVTSLDTSRPEGQAALMRLLGEADQKAKEIGTGDVTIRDWVLHEVTLTNEESGEQFRTLRLVLQRPDGTTVSTVSGPIIDMFRYVVGMYGRGTWDPPVTIGLKWIRRGANRDYLTIAGCTRANAVRKSK